MERSLQNKEGIKSSLITKATSLFENFLEAEQHLFSREIAHLGYWHFVRFFIYHEILIQKKWIEKESSSKQETLFNIMGIGVGLLKNSLLYRIGRDQKRADLLILNSANKIKRNGRFIDPLIDTWLQDINSSFTNWEDHSLWRHKKHGQNPNLFYLDSLHLRAIISGKAFLRADNEIEREAAYLCNFARQFDVQLSQSKTSQFLTLVISQHRSCAAVIKNQLYKKRVKLIILINHYDPLRMLMTSIAKSLGIYVVELQHGNMGRYHIAYNFRQPFQLDSLPNEILTFGKFWNDTTRISQNGVKLTAVGRPFFEEQIKSLSKPQQHNKTKILILSQETIGYHLGKIAVELSQRLDSREYEILYKMHPREYPNWKMKYPKEFKSLDIKVLTNVNLYELLNETDVHIGVYSTTIMESLAFNKKLILVDSYGVHFLADLVKMGRAFFAKNAGEIIQIIQSKQGFFLNQKDIKCFWEVQSKEKVLKRIQEILDLIKSEV